ncbi:hypothetical protein EMIT0P12_60112 [Pseudomonas sp. IT-P12]
MARPDQGLIAIPLGRRYSDGPFLLPC